MITREHAMAWPWSLPLRAGWETVLESNLRRIRGERETPHPAATAAAGGSGGGRGDDDARKPHRHRGKRAGRRHRDAGEDDTGAGHA